MHVIPASDRTRLARVMRDGWTVSDEIAKAVASILADVRARGDAAVIDYTRSFDHKDFGPEKLRVPIPMLENARGLVSREIAQALELVKERLRRFHDRQRPAEVAYAEEDGSRYALMRRPLESVAAYVPGASAVLPSAVLMSAVPARMAGVNRVIVLTPPRTEGAIHPAVLFACALCGVDELYAVGGAQAVAAAAFGTESIAAVEKIVGPGGQWVTEAKRQVFGRCGIDGLTGPCEVLVVADDGANSEYVAGELLAQAEHHAGRLGVVSESRSLLEAVAQLLDTLELQTLARGEIISAAIERNCALIHAATREEVFEVVERFAPACVSLQVRDAGAYLPHIRRAGAVFVGDMTPVACGDYLAGTNCIVPTSGTARFSSALTLADFMRSFAVLENSTERMMNDALTIAALAELEGLPQHAQTVRMRYGS